MQSFVFVSISCRLAGPWQWTTDTHYALWVIPRQMTGWRTGWVSGDSQQAQSGVPQTGRAASGPQEPLGCVPAIKARQACCHMRHHCPLEGDWGGGCQVGALLSRPWPPGWEP